MHARVASPVIALSLMFCAASVLGCASAPQPTERLASAKAGVRSAKELGASNVPKAALHVRLAEEQIDRANKLIKEDDNERADALLQRAAADANLAVALTHEARALNSAQADLQPEKNP